MKKTAWMLIGLLMLSVEGHALTVDLKSKTSEKPDLLPCEIGLATYLEESGVTVKNFGEDLAIWLHNLRRRVQGASVTVTVEVRLTKPSLWREGPSLASTEVEFSYSDEPMFFREAQKRAQDESTPSKVWANAKSQMKRAADTALVEALVGGQALHTAVMKLLKQAGYQVKS